MITISRVTEASTAPIGIWIRTDCHETTLALPGPLMTVRIPGTRLLGLSFDQPRLYGIRIVSCDKEYRLEELVDASGAFDPFILNRVDAIRIFDGFLFAPGFPGMLPGWSFTPSYLMGNILVESGNTYIYPAFCSPPVPPPVGPPPGPIGGPTPPLARPLPGPTGGPGPIQAQNTMMPNTGVQAPGQGFGVLKRA